MSENLLIQPLVLEDYSFPPADTNPGFTDLFSSEVGNAAAPEDGFDDVVAELEGIVDALDSGLALLAGADGGDLDETFADILTLDAEGPRSNIVDLGAAAADFHSGVDGLGNLLTPALPAPVAPGGKPPGSPPGPCEAFVHFNPALPKPLTVQVPAIFGGGPLHITGRRFVGAKAGAWRETDNFPAVIEGDVKYVISVTQLVQLPAGAPGSFVITTAEHGDITMFCMVLDAGANVPVIPPQGVGTEPAFPPA